MTMRSVFALRDCWKSTTRTSTMITNAKRMSCGNCGQDKFAIYQAGDVRLVAECLSCKSTSVITPSRVALSINWGENSDGILCVMGDGEDQFEP